LTMISLNRFSCRMRLLQPQMGTPAQSIHRNRRRRIDMKKAMMVTLSAVTMIMAVGNARAEMPTDAKKTAYFVGKAASQLPPGYITEEVLRKLAAATGCDTPFLVEDFIQTERDQEQYFRTQKK
jgi:hypothetical protein